MTPELTEFDVQLALDQTSLDEAEALVLELLARDRSDSARALTRVEVGTPLVLSAGSRGIARIRELVGAETTVVADVKVCDAGARIAAAAFSAGADTVTVVAGVIDDVTWNGVLDAAEEAAQASRRRTVLVDLLNASLDDARATQLLAARLEVAASRRIPVELCVHRAKSGAAGFRQLFEPLRRLPSAFDRSLVAGRVTAGEVKPAMSAGFDVVIVGGGITEAGDPRAAWTEFAAERDGFRQELYWRLMSRE